MRKPIEIAFEDRRIMVPLEHLVPVKLVSPSTKNSKKFEQIAISVKEVGLVEPLVVHPAKGRKRQFLLLDGHMNDYGTKTLYTKGFYALRPPGTVHGPFGTDIGCTVLEVVWYDKEWYSKNYRDKND